MKKIFISGSLKLALTITIIYSSSFFLNKYNE